MTTETTMTTLTAKLQYANGKTITAKVPSSAKLGDRFRHAGSDAVAWVVELEPKRESVKCVACDYAAYLDTHGM